MLVSFLGQRALHFVSERPGWSRRGEDVEAATVFSKKTNFVVLMDTGECPQPISHEEECGPFQRNHDDGPTHVLVYPGVGTANVKIVQEV